MQIFVLDTDPSRSAQYHADKHVIKQILESAQLLSATCRLHNIEIGYKITHKNHPCRLWLDESIHNYEWLLCLGFALCAEYTYRYGKTHKSLSILEDCADVRNKLNLPTVKQTPFAQAMPDEYKHPCAVTAYRQYYIGEKQHILKYTNRTWPSWLTKN